MRSAAAVLLSTALGAWAIDVYVDPHGCNSSPGTSPQKPFKTLAKAQNTVRNLIANGMSEDINVHVAPGLYPITTPLHLDSRDSGERGFAVNWVGDNATISGGLRVTGWKELEDGVYSAAVPAGTKSRNLFVGTSTANYGRKKIQSRKDFTFTNSSLTWTNATYDWLMTTPGIESAEVRFINSFTDRVAPISSVGDRELVMKQNTWANQIIGWDTVSSPFADMGVWVQNNLALLSEGGEFYLDSEAGTVYYKPLAGEDMASIDTYLAVQETILVIGGTYDDPAHDLTFRGFQFSHSTWLKPGEVHGYVDQQTGGYMEAMETYPEFEASRPHWSQMPSAVQISAARDISLAGCTFTQLGAGGLGIGNDPNAHFTGVGLSTSNVSIVDSYFTQVMGNGVTAGGIREDAHHPRDPRMLNTRITISGNIFYNNSALFSSTVPILTTYLQHSLVAENDIFHVPYSGLCYGYGWGSNDAGGSPEYMDRGLYEYQPLYTSPTTLRNNVVRSNLIHSYGLSHTDLGGIYTLSKSPETFLVNNYIYDSNWYGFYNDEGSNSYHIEGNDVLVNHAWYHINNGWQQNQNSGNNTVIGNWGLMEPDGDSPCNAGNTCADNFLVPSIDKTSAEGQRTAWRAGIPPAKRAGRPVSNSPDLPDAHLAFAAVSEKGKVAVNLTNFDDVAYKKVVIEVTAGDDDVHVVDAPTEVPANSFVIATFILTSKGQGGSNVTGTASYENPRMGWTRTLSVTQ